MNMEPSFPRFWVKLVKYISAELKHFQLLAKDTTCASRKSKVETVWKDVTPSDRQQCAFFQTNITEKWGIWTIFLTITGPGTAGDT